MSDTETYKEDGMRFETEVWDTELQALLEEFEDIADAKAWRKRLAWLEEQVGNGTGSGYLWGERCALELAWASLREGRMAGKLLVERMETAELGFLSFAGMVVQCHRRLTDTGRNRLQGMLRDATNKDHGLGSVAHEMRVACHLMGRGYDVVFNDMEGRAGFDFLARKGGASAEVECKFISCDIGRQIHRSHLYRLGDRITETMLNYLGSLRTGLLVRLTIPGRLEPREERQTALCRLLSRAIVSGRIPLEEDCGRVTVREFDVERVAAGWVAAGAFDKGRMAASLRKHFGIVNRNLFVFVNPGRGAVVVVVESSVRDRVLRAIHDDLRKSSKRQLSRNEPAILCCHLADLTAGQLTGLMMKGEDGIDLDHMTLDLIGRRQHLHSVTYTAAGVARTGAALRNGLSQQSRGESGPAYTIANPDHEMIGDERLSVFGEGWP